MAIHDKDGKALIGTGETSHCYLFHQCGDGVEPLQEKGFSLVSFETTCPHFDCASFGPSKFMLMCHKSSLLPLAPAPWR